VIFVKGDTSYTNWLRSRERWLQHQVLGVTRAIIWSKYNLHLMDLLDDDGRPLKIAELVDRYGPST
jgi:hypothetical protein